jgi:hypothetical protein
MSMLKLGMVDLELVIGRPTAFQSLKLFQSAASYCQSSLDQRVYNVMLWGKW